MRPERNGVRFRRSLFVWVAMVCLGVLCFPGIVVGETKATAWDWARTSSFFDSEGASVTPHLVSDPAGKRQGMVVALDTNSWGYRFTCTEGAHPFFFESGRDYTLVLDVYADDGAVHTVTGTVFDLLAGCPADCCLGSIVFTGDGAWHRVYLSVNEFSGASGGYWLRLCTRPCSGTWYIGDISVHEGVGKL